MTEQIENSRAQASQMARDRANVPPRYRGCTFDNYVAHGPAQGRVLRLCRRYVDTFAEQRELGRCLFLLGKMGTGKTHLASAMVHALCDQATSARYTTLDAMSSRWRATYSREAQETQEAVQRAYVDPALLVIDEVGVQHASEHELLVINRICCKRYDMGDRPTIFIGNITEDELPLYLGDRVVERAFDAQGVVVTFDWASHRRSAESC